MVMLSAIVGEGLDQHRHAQVRPAQRVGHGALVAEVGQRDQHAVDLLAMCVEQLGALVGVLQALDAAVGRVLRPQRDDLEAGVFQHLDHLFPARLAQVAGKEAAVADDQSEGYGFHIQFSL